MKTKTLFQKITSSVLTLALLGSVVFAATAQTQAANTYLTALSMELEDNAVSALGYSKITFTSTSAIAASGTVVITLPTGFSWNALLDFNDIDVTDDAVNMTMAATASLTAWGVARTSATVLTLTNDTDTAVAAASEITIEIGDNATTGAAGRVDALTNSSSASTEADPHIVTITSGTDSATKLAIALVTDTTVALQAVVLPHLTMTLSDVDHSLGELDETNIVSGSNTITIDTNAANGWELYYTATTFANDDGNGITLAANAGSTAVAGSEEWGVNMKDNATPDVGLEPSVTGAPGTTNALTLATGYGTADSYKVIVGGTRTIIASRNGSTDAQVLTVSYVATAATTTPAGNYSATVEWIVIGLF